MATRWSAITGGTDGTVYSPGDEITNVGLLYTRIYPTYDGTDSNSPVKVSVAAERSALGGNARPTASTLGTLYSGKGYYSVPCLEKQIPGLLDAEIWTLMTDDDNEFVGRTYSGKPKGLTNVSLLMPALPELIGKLTDHAANNSIFTVIYCYDDGNKDDLYYVVIPRCQILGIESKEASNNSGGTVRVKFKPTGGVFIPKYIKDPRVAQGQGT